MRFTTLIVRPCTGSLPSLVHALPSPAAGWPSFAGPGSQVGQTGVKTDGSMLRTPMVMSVPVTPRAVAPPFGTLVSVVAPAEPRGGVVSVGATAEPRDGSLVSVGAPAEPGDGAVPLPPSEGVPTARVLPS